MTNMNRILCVVQILLALLFLFAGAMKFIIPIEQMTKQMPLPAWFLYFIGAVEILGAIGLILPQLLRVRPGLTPLAAMLLVPIMIGATAITLQTAPASGAILPLVTGILCACVGYGRRHSFRRQALNSDAQRNL